MRPNQWIGLVAAALTATLAGAALAAGNQGSEENPLVTLSYLRDVVVPEIMEQVDQKLDGRTETPRSSSFQAMEMDVGQVLTLSAGTQLLFRSGAAVSSPDLTDLTVGITSGTMEENHLYLATVDEQKVTPLSRCTAMVLGEYRLS